MPLCPITYQAVSPSKFQQVFTCWIYWGKKLEVILTKDITQVAVNRADCNWGHTLALSWVANAPDTAIPTSPHKGFRGPPHALEKTENVYSLLIEEQILRSDGSHGHWKINVGSQNSRFCYCSLLLYGFKCICSSGGAPRCATGNCGRASESRVGLGQRLIQIGEIISSCFSL